MAKLKAKPRILSLSEIHRRTGLSMAHISKIYSGKRRASLSAAARIADAQRITVDDLIVQIAAEAARKQAAAA